MATRLSAGPSFRKPDLERANDAITAVLAEAAFAHRGTQLKRQYKRAEQEAKTFNTRFAARSARYEAQNEALVRRSNALQAQQREQQALVKARDLLSKDWEKQGLTYRQAQRQFKAMNKDIRRMGRRYESAYESFLARQRQQQQVYKSFKRMSQKAQRLQSAYAAAVKRYNAHGNVVRYVP